MSSLWLPLWTALLLGNTVLDPPQQLEIPPRLDRPLSSDRAAFTPGAAAVELGRFQIETGSSHVRFPTGSALARNDWHLAETLVRFGLPAGWELRFGLDGYRFREQQGDTNSGWGDTSIGLKKSWQPRHGKGPEAAVLLETSLPTGGDRFGHQAEPAVAFIVGWRLATRLELGAAGRWQRLRPAIGEDTDQLGGGLRLRWRWTRQWQIDGEIFSLDAEHQRRRDFAALGLTYDWVPDIAFDLRWSEGLASSRPERSWAVGATVRF